MRRARVSFITPTSTRGECGLPGPMDEGQARARA
jgi:hypothetical protein